MSLTNEKLIPPPTLRQEMDAELFKLFWPDVPLDGLGNGDLTCFVSRVTETLKTLQPYESKYGAKTCRDIPFVLDHLCNGRSDSQEAVLHELKRGVGTSQDAAILRSIDLVVQIWLGLNVHSITSFGRFDAWNTRIEWKRGETLQNMTSTHFDNLRKPTGAASHSHPLFAATRLKHMRKSRRHPLALKPHRTLEAGRPTGAENAVRIPAQSLDEAIRTLELLFPLAGQPAEALRKEEGVCMHSVRTDGAGARPQSTDEFAYWRARLEQLHRLFDSPPENFVQAAVHVRKPPSQWTTTTWISTFGILMLTFLFGILATIYAVQQYRIAEKSYGLQRAQACQMSAALPGFC